MKKIKNTTKLNEFFTTEFIRSLKQISNIDNKVQILVERVNNYKKHLCFHPYFFIKMYYVSPPMVNDVFLIRKINYIGEETNNENMLFCYFGKCEVCNKYYFYVNPEFEEMISELSSLKFKF